MPARLAWIVTAALALAPPAGCKKLLAPKTNDDTLTSDPGATTAPLPPPPTQSGTVTSASNAAPAGDALLTLGTGAWVTYQPEGPTHFSVLLPQRPQETAPPIKIGGAPVAAKQAVASRIGAIYTFLFADVPASVKGDPHAILDAARDDAISRAGSAVLRFERDLKLGKNLGREFQAEATAPFPITITGHFYVIGRRLYEQEITVPSSVSEGTYVDMFFGSLNVPNEGVGATMTDVDPASASASPQSSASAGPQAPRLPKKKK